MMRGWHPRIAAAGGEPPARPRRREREGRSHASGDRAAPARPHRPGPLPRAAGLLLCTWVGVAASVSDAGAWGFVAHRLVVEAAAGLPPEPLRGFFSETRARLSDLSLEPDTVLKDADPRERARHFFNLDALVSGPSELGGLPRTLAGAERRFGRRRLEREGVLPWWIAETTTRLASAMRSADTDAILREAAYLSHYVADLHQPLHLTRNFDGQRTGNDGVHAAYERLMIEAAPGEFNPDLAAEGPVAPVGAVADWAIRRAGEIYTAIPSILAADTASRASLRVGGIGYESNMERRVGRLTRSLLGRAAGGTADLWLTAWIEAGRPDPRHWSRRRPSAPDSGQSRIPAAIP